MSDNSALTFTATTQLMDLLKELSTEIIPPVENRHRRIECRTLPRPSKMPNVRSWSEKNYARYHGDGEEAILTRRKKSSSQTSSTYSFAEPAILSLPNRRNRGRSKFISRPSCPVFASFEPEKRASSEFQTERPTLCRSNSLPNLSKNAFNREITTRFPPQKSSLVLPFETLSNIPLPEKFCLKSYDSGRIPTADTNPPSTIPLSPTPTLCNHSRSSSGLHSTDTLDTTDHSNGIHYSSPPLALTVEDKTNHISMSTIESADETVDDDFLLDMYFDKVFAKPPPSDEIKGGWKRRWKWLTKAWEKQKDVKNCTRTMKWNSPEERKNEGRSGHR